MALKYKCHNCNMQIGYDGLCYVCREEKRRNDILAWTKDEIEEKIKRLIENVKEIESWRNKEYEEADDLVSILGIFPKELQRAAAKEKIYSLPKLYYHAPEDVRDKLIKCLLETEDEMEASELMECIAMQGDDASLKVLYDLEKHPRKWQKKLFAMPSVYAESGGWTFDKNGKRRELNYKKCYPLIKKDKKDKAESPVIIGRAREERCRHCGGRLVDILIVDGRDERLEFLKMDGIITATCCPSCVVFQEAAFSKFSLDGKSEMIESDIDIDEAEDYLHDEGIKKLDDNTFVLGDKEVPVFYESEGDTINTIGGFASWVQDWNYIKCPKCKKPMKYLGQIHWGILTDDEGTLYVEMCDTCKIVGMHHQQT